MYKIGDVIQFTEDHKWCGSFGIIEEIKELDNGSIRYMIGVPIPQRGTAYIFSTNQDNFEYIGRAVMTSATK